MPQRLSDPAWVAFQNDIDMDALGLPPWGGVVEWQGRAVLVYVCPASGSVCQRGEAMLTDVSDIRARFQNVPAVYDAGTGVWIYHLPQEIMREIGFIARDTLEGTGKLLRSALQTIGEGAADVTGPLLQSLTLPLLIVLGIFLLYEFRR